MITSILVDDEQPSLDELNFLINLNREVQLIGIYTNPLEALKAITITKPDVVFLDICMPEISGVTLAKEITSANKNTQIVFTTAFDNYAIEAFDLNALDYLLKPVSKERLNKTISKMLQRKSIPVKPKEDVLSKIYEIEKYIKQASDKIIIKDDEEFVFLNSSDVLYIEIQNGNSIVVTKTQKYITKVSLDTWEERLMNQGFFRCHRSFVVNLKHISKIVSWFNGYIIKLHDCSAEIPISRNNIKELKKVINI